MRKPAFLLLAGATLLPWVSPALALALGAGFALAFGSPFPDRTGRAASLLLKASVVGLGFGMSLHAVARAGSAGVGYTVAAIAGTLALGIALARALRVRRDPGLLIATGTAICGGSAIAAVGSAVDADAESMSVALATVFVLNAVALYLFPPIGHLAGLSQQQFGVWAAIAIHDTSSVVGAAAAYGPEALADATVLKLARALWIAPVTLGVVLARRASAEGGAGADGATGGEGGEGGEGEEGRGWRGRVAIPWFILLFLAAALLRTVVPGGAPLFDAVAWVARRALVLTLFLIGAGLTRATLRSVGGRPFLQGLILWLVVAAVSLWAVALGVPG